jgi:hypothetical protein
LWFIFFTHELRVRQFLGFSDFIRFTHHPNQVSIFSPQHQFWTSIFNLSSLVHFFVMWIAGP